MGQSSEKKNGSNVTFYKGLEHFETPEVVEPWIEDEFPDRESLKGVPRRDVLKLMGAAAALAGLSGCRYQPAQKIVPFVQQPEGAVSGLRKQFATASVKDGYSVGLLAEQVDGRPVRVDGNPLHSASRGSIDSQLTAEILNLYDPDRLKNPTFKGTPVGWNDALIKFEAAMQATENGSGVAVLSQTVNSPSVARLAGKMKELYPGMKWYQYEPVNHDSAREAARLALGGNYVPIYDFTKADIVVSLDSDVMHTGPMSIRYSRDYAEKRKPTDDMSRVYAFESHPQTTGLVSDHRVRVKPSEMLAVVQAIGAGVGVPGASAGTLPSTVEAKLIDAVVSDLRAAGSRGVLVAGAHLPAAVQAAAIAVNQFLAGGANEAVRYIVDPQPIAADHGQDIEDLMTAMNSNQVSVLLILGGNPAYDLPPSTDFASAIAKVTMKAHLSTHKCETSKHVDYVLPQAHFLESWNDGVALDGTVTITQPIIEPIYEGRTPLQVIDKLIGDTAEPRQIVMETAELSAAGNWNEVLARGFYGSPAPAAAAVVTEGLLGSLTATEASGLELLILPDPMIGDGRNANNMWLQETPKPVTNLTWDNALLMSAATAKKLGVTAVNERKVGPVPFYGKADMVEVTVGSQKLEVPAWVNLGQADDVLVLHMGYGRTVAGDFGTAKGEKMGGGFNANVLRTSPSEYWTSGVTVKKLDKQYALANVQHHNTIDVSMVDKDREIYKMTTLAELKDGHPFGEHHHEHKGYERSWNEFGENKTMSLYDGSDFAENPDKNYQWAMTIDLGLCTGCNACVTACQAENNIPTVGKEQVMKGREMHWIRVDRYYKGTGDSLDKDNPPIVVQPVTCMHCEQAPCEPVCPVAATVHSHEGLNQMVYNRCVGTRYCSNNCPYKVRRFNFFHYSQRADNVPVLKMLQNPDVTVRYRGVMEKCTYCVQRINHKRIEAKRDDREVQDGEVVTACQAACPSGAIIFGDMRKKENAVAISRADKRNYLMLEELNTRPRTTYLSRVTNPHPSLVKEEAH